MTNWHVIQTVGGKEVIIGKELHRGIGLGWYVPMEERAITRRSRVIKHHEPLLPGYVFVSGLADGAYRDVRETKYVVRIVDGLLSQREIEIIKILEAEHNRALEDRRQARTTYRVDDRVRVKEGPFKDMASLITKVRGSKVVLEFSIFGRPTRFVTTTDNLEKVA